MLDRRDNMSETKPQKCRGCEYYDPDIKECAYWGMPRKADDEACDIFNSTNKIGE
jgi:hypothetical protein